MDIYRGSRISVIDYVVVTNEKVIEEIIKVEEGNRIESDTIRGGISGKIDEEKRNKQCN